MMNLELVSRILFEIKIEFFTSARSSYSKLEYSTSVNPQNSKLVKLEVEKNLKNLHYSNQNSKYSSKIRAWYLVEIDSLILDETRTDKKWVCSLSFYFTEIFKFCLQDSCFILFLVIFQKKKIFVTKWKPSFSSIISVGANVHLYGNSI